MNDLTGEQLQLEKHCISDGVVRYGEMLRKSSETGALPNMKSSEQMILRWFKPLCASIDVDKSQLRTKDQWERWEPAYSAIETEKCAIITIHETLDRCFDHPDGIQVSKLTFGIGRAVLAELQVALVSKRDPNEWKRINNHLHLDKTQIRKRSNKIHHYFKRSIADPVYSALLCTALGARLFWHLILIASSRDNNEKFHAAFHVEVRPVGVKTVKWVVVDDEVIREIDFSNRIHALLRPRLMPMIVEPVPWSKSCEGGYLRIRRSLISRQTGPQRKAIEAHDMTRVYEAVNSLSATRWKVAGDILDDEKAIWNGGGGVAGIPSASNMPYPPKLASDDPKMLKRTRERVELWRRNNENVRERNMFDISIQQAEKFRQYETIWIPQMMDFRGRCYAITSHFNYQNRDFVRALFRFSDKRPIGERGRRWLRIHAANCYGIDKVSFDARVQWSENHMDDILRSSRQPMDTDFWIHADNGSKPWQFLAACRAIDDEDEIGSRIPIPIDGSANGSQHYAALARDRGAAEAVNLLPAAQPNDLYTSVARMVSERVEHDSLHSTRMITIRDHGKEPVIKPESEMAAMLVGKISRSVVKDTVMTRAYGMSNYGSVKKLRQSSIGLMEVDESVIFQLCVYLSKILIKVSDEIMPGAKSVMSWLKKLARVIAKKEGQAVRWISPIGFPVVQPYRKPRVMTISTILQAITIACPDESMEIMPNRHVIAFPPNFIHSLDTSHMMMMANECRRKKMAFAAVHDGFWGRAEEMDDLHEMAANTFADLHSRNILLDLLQQFRGQYRYTKFIDPPPPGDLDIDECRKANYMFS